jgi:hypothetical protein
VLPFPELNEVAPPLECLEKTPRYREEFRTLVSGNLVASHTRPPANTGPLGSAEPRRAPHKTSALDQVSEQLLAHHSKLCPPVVTHAKDNSDGS